MVSYTRAKSESLGFSSGTGMAAIGTTLFSLLRTGDHFVSSSFLFGNTNSLFNTFTTQGIDVTFVDATDLEAELISRGLLTAT